MKYSNYCCTIFSSKALDYLTLKILHIHTLLQLNSFPILAPIRLLIISMLRKAKCLTKGLFNFICSLNEHHTFKVTTSSVAN